MKKKNNNTTNGFTKVIGRSRGSRVSLKYLEPEGVWIIFGPVAVMSYYKGHVPIIDDLHLTESRQLDDLIWCLKELKKQPKSKVIYRRKNSII